MRHYDNIASHYSESHNQAYYRWRRDKVLGFAELSDKTLLDVGCGSGTFLNDPKVNVALGVGLDISHKILMEAKAKTKSAVFLQGDGERLPFADDSFDVVVSLDALEHTPSPLAAVKEMCRVARSKIVVATPNATVADPVFAVLEVLRLKMPEGEHSMVKKRDIVETFEREGWSVKIQHVALGLCVVYLAEALGAGSS